jgi:hypothetical protein
MTGWKFWLLMAAMVAYAAVFMLAIYYGPTR